MDKELKEAWENYSKVWGKEKTEMTNAERANIAEQLLFTYDDIVNECPSVDSITDLLCDLMHYCKQNNTELTFDECLERARRHFDVES